MGAEMHGYQQNENEWEKDCLIQGVCLSTKGRQKEWPTDGDVFGVKEHVTGCKVTVLFYSSEHALVMKFYQVHGDGNDDDDDNIKIQLG